MSYHSDDTAKQHYFVNFVGAGLDSYTLELMGSGGGNSLRYLYYVIKGLLSYRSPSFTATLKEQKVHLKSLMFLVCIGRYGGAGMDFAPRAKANDGLFNVLTIADMPLHKRILSLSSLYNGKINEHPQVQTWEVEKLKIEADPQLFFQCDGEIIDALPVDVICVKEALNLIC